MKAIITLCVLVSFLVLCLAINWITWELKMKRLKKKVSNLESEQSLFFRIPFDVKWKLIINKATSLERLINWTQGRYLTSLYPKPRLIYMAHNINKFQSLLEKVVRIKRDAENSLDYQEAIERSKKATG